MNARLLDLTDGDKEYHGNYQAARSDEAVIKYVTKDGKYIASKDIEELTHKSECRKGKRKIMGQEMVKCANVEELGNWVLQKRPELALEYERVERSFIALKRATEKAFIAKGVRGIWIQGDAGIGKTHTIMANFMDQLYEKA